jgi:hypothetical protein
MRMLGRTAMVLGLACLSQAPSLAAQSIIGFDSFKWYIGAQGGVTIFETPNQTRGGIFTAGGHFLVTARRTGLLLEVQEGFKKDQLSSFHDQSAAGLNREVRFNNLRRYSASVLIFPFKTIAQPYVGIGFGVLQTGKEYPDGPFGTPADEAGTKILADRVGSHTFAMFTGGVQVRLANFAVFGQYQITTAPGNNFSVDRTYAGHLIEGPTHTLMGGLRISLGSSKEGDATAVSD